jgi:hypothetical protein
LSDSQPFRPAAQLRGASARAAPLCFLDMAVRYRAQLRLDGRAAS